MVFCDYCLTNVAGEIIDDSYLCCGDCGKVLEDHHFSEKVVFCDHCWDYVSGTPLHDGHLCCGDCEKLLEDSILFEELHDARPVVKKVDDYIPSEGRLLYRNIKFWEHDNQECLEELAAKEKKAKKAFEAFFRNCSNDSLAARDKLAQSAIESLEKSRKKHATPENLKKAASENVTNSESKSKEKMKEDEFKHASYQGNGGRKKRQRRFAPRICK